MRLSESINFYNAEDASKHQPRLKKKVLLTNYFIRDFTGSELAIYDLTKEFLQRNYDVTVGAFIFNEPLLEKFRSLEVTLLDLNNASTEHFDLIWAQHFITLDTCLLDLGITADKIIYSSLSPYESLESPPISIKQVDLFLANSPETKSVLVNMGLKEPNIRVFPNPVTNEFFDETVVIPETLKKLAVVSNHIPVEVQNAVALLSQQGVEVKEFGIKNHFVLITPNILSKFDAVITIGRTVQYCLAMGIPVYCYDRFGGPGWLNKSNIDRAAMYNFSGRCCNLAKSTDTLVITLTQNFNTAREQIAFYKEYAVSHFKLALELSNILDDLSINKVREECPSIVFSNIAFRQQGFIQGLERQMASSTFRKGVVYKTLDFKLRNKLFAKIKTKTLSTKAMVRGIKMLIQDMGGVMVVFQYLFELVRKEGTRSTKYLLRSSSFCQKLWPQPVIDKQVWLRYYESIRSKFRKKD